MNIISPQPPIPLLTVALAAAYVASVLTSAASDTKAEPEDERAIPPDYVTLFPTWQRGFIHEGRLIHAAGEHGIMQAVFSSAMTRPPGGDSRVLLPFIHLDSDSRVPGRPGPSPVNSIHPTLPPLLHCWDVDHDQLMLVFGRMKPTHDFQLRIYSLDSIGGPVREIPDRHALHTIKLHPDADINLAHHPNIGQAQDEDRRTIPKYFLAPNTTMHFSIRLLPGQDFQMLIQPLGSWVKCLVDSTGQRSPAGGIEFLPAYPPEPFIHFVLDKRFFLARRGGALEMIPEQCLKPGRYEEIQAELKTWRLNEHGDYIIDEGERAAGRVGDPLDMVADFSKIPDWVASDPATHFMVQDRDAEMVRFFWGVSGYAELQVLEQGVQDKEGPDNQAAEAVRVQFEELPAPPEMEDLRAMLLSPPEFERPKVFYLYDPRPHEFRGPQLGLPWRE